MISREKRLLILLVSAAVLLCLAACKKPVEIKIPVSKVELRPDNLRLKTGETQTLNATVLPRDASDISLTWQSDRPAVASVSPDGEVTAVAEGTAVISARANDGSGAFGTSTITVLPLIIPVSSIALNHTEKTLEIGESLQLTATVKPADATNQDVRWSVADPAVASVTTLGLVVALSPGATQVIATSADGGVSASCAITVNAPPAQSKFKFWLTVEQPDETTAEEEMANHYRFEWKSAGQMPKLHIEIRDENGKMVSDKNLDHFSIKTIYLAPNCYYSVTQYLPCYIEEIRLVSPNLSTATWHITLLRIGTAIYEFSYTDGSETLKQTLTVETTMPEEEPEAVDLGLSVRWASANLGSASIVEPGIFVAWGAREQQDTYDWDHYLWGREKQLSRYNTKVSQGTVDNETTLRDEDDIAHLLLGGNWRMPTVEEVSELVENCTWSLHQSEEQGNYYEATSLKNGKSIRFPVNPYITQNYAGGSAMKDNISLWSSSLNADNPTTAFTLFCLETGRPVTLMEFPRSYGMPIRPVCPKL